jgi:hypothetical protein
MNVLVTCLKLIFTYDSIKMFNTIVAEDPKPKLKFQIGNLIS